MENGCIEAALNVGLQRLSAFAESYCSSRDNDENRQL
jgi:hypothetical protein